jgi:hypothetical protein
MEVYFFKFLVPLFCRDCSLFLFFFFQFMLDIDPCDLRILYVVGAN